MQGQARTIVVVLAVVCIGLSSCQAIPEPVPTLTAVPASTSAPPPTSVPQSTSMPTAVPTSTSAPPPTLAPIPGELVQAVSALRQLAPENLDGNQSAALDQATNTIVEAGPEGIRALRQGLDEGRQDGNPDPAFELLAASLLWEIGGLAEAGAIADIWSGIPPDEWNFPSVFMTALDAASTQDPAAVPLLKALLADRTGELPLPLHATTMVYPMTQLFVWGAYGSKAMPVLHDVLQTSPDPAAQETAITILSRAQYLPALPRIRQAIESEDAGVRDAAITALGEFGHPDDYDLLVSGLASPEATSLLSYLAAVIWFDDVRATPHVIPLLESINPEVRELAALGLALHLATPEALTALWDCAAVSNDPELADLCGNVADFVLYSQGLTREKYANLSPEQQASLLSNYRTSDRVLQPGERAVTHDELLDVVAEWRETGQIVSEKWDWVESRHILAVATPADIDLLLDGKAGFYARL
jgi:hypothetical protein